VSTEKQIDCETYRLIITRRNGSELLCFPDGLRYSLPSVDISRWHRVAEQINREVKERWNLDAYSLSTFRSGEPAETFSPIQFQIMECIQPNGYVPQLAHWIPLSSLTDSSFRDSRILPNIHAALEQSGTHANNQCMRPFATAGWLRDLCLWIQEKIDPMNLRLTGQFRQLTASPTFNLIRFETNGAALWFKAVGEPNIREFRIVSTLGTLFPSFLPGMVAPLPERNAWLMEEAEGASPDANFAHWNRVSASLAELQKMSVQDTARLLAVGCRDISSASLLSCVDDFFRTINELMNRQIKTPPSILSAGELLDLSNRLKDALSALATSGIPEALNHLDFNPGNILVSDRHCTVIDWAEAAIGHPFVTFQYLLEHFTRNNRESRLRQAELTSSYAERWETLGSPIAISRGLTLAPLVAVFAYAVSSGIWRDPARLDNPKTAGYFRGLTRRMKREADALENGSLRCMFA
jgi:hypothetical protein